MQKSTGTRIDELLAALNISQKAFAERIGLTTGAVGNWKNRDVGINVINKIVNAFPSVRKEWLLTGNGDILVSNQSLSEPNPTPNIGEEIKDLDEAIRLSQKRLSDRSQEERLFELYSARIRQLDADRARIADELMKLDLARKTLSKEIEEIRSLKSSLQEANNDFNAKDASSMASDNDNNT
jgi:transcriptional regulator with XRE-family HTH domain